MPGVRREPLPWHPPVRAASGAAAGPVPSARCCPRVGGDRGDAAEITFGGSTAVVRGQRIEGTTKGGRSRVISIDSDTVVVPRDHRRSQTAERLAAGSS